ncbi:hypothetical protein [Escherichia coli]|uniref:hypothetical protein n=1 Tax=Escherichia coli TaxID=562 RepID=UPI0019A93AD8|nr:hypothetical protein [Escherichia coli]HAM4114097.1 hypothetical protein [Escherichia coli]
MAEFGAMILMDNWNPFVTPQSTPFCLYGKYTFNSSANGSSQQVAQNIALNADYPVMVFIKTTNTAQPTPVMSYRNGGNVYVAGVNPYNQSFTLTAYVFAIFPQILPKWGLAIWDASGKLVLTNESRVLSDLQTVGTPGANGGINIDQTLSGSWAVAPAQLGQTIIVNNSTRPPTIYTINAYSSCRFDGANTRINAGGTSTGAGSPGGVTNTGISLTAINTAAYD